jgi:hypothetical protein
VLLRPLPPKKASKAAQAARSARASATPYLHDFMASDEFRNPPEPWAYIKDGVARFNNGKHDAADRTLAAAVVAGCWYALTYRPWVWATVAIALPVATWVGSLCYGASTYLQCKEDIAPWRWTTRRAAVALILLMSLGLLQLRNGAFIQLMLLSLGMAQMFAYRPVEVTTGIWWSEKRLIINWTDAGLFGASGKAPDELWFRRVEPMRLDDSGVRTITVVPMVGHRKNARVLNVGVDKVQGARAALERVMGLKVGQLHVSHKAGIHDAGAITLAVTPVVEKTEIVRGVVPEEWDYSQPLWVGNDPLGRPVYRRTWGVHSGFVAMTQKGKTAAVIWDAAHAVTDVRIPIYLLDYKGDDKDFLPLVPLCKRAIVGASLDNARKTLTVLQEIEQLSESRKSITVDEPGVLVIVDEWYRLLSLCQRLDPELAKKLDRLMTELMATAASRRIKFISLFQGGTSEYINKPMRINIGQRFCGVTELPAEMGYFMGKVHGQMPKQPGQFVFKDDGVAPVLVTHPYLDPAGFAEVCARAAQRRGKVSLDKLDPLTQAVRSMLSVESMKAGTIMNMLPEELKPNNMTVLGLALKKMPGVEKYQDAEGIRFYRLIEGATA